MASVLNQPFFQDEEAAYAKMRGALQGRLPRLGPKIYATVSCFGASRVATRAMSFLPTSIDIFERVGSS